MNDLVDAFGRRKVAQPYVTEITQRHLRRQAVSHAIGHGFRQQYLTAVRRGHE